MLGLHCTIKWRFVIEFVVHVVFCLIQVYSQGLRNMDLMLIITTLCLPTIGCLGMALTVPYVFARSFIPLFGKFSTFGIKINLFYRISLLELLNASSFRQSSGSRLKMDFLVLVMEKYLHLIFEKNLNIRMIVFHIDFTKY